MSPEDAFDAFTAAFWHARAGQCRSLAREYAIGAAIAYASSIACFAESEWEDAVRELQRGKDCTKASLMYGALQVIAEALSRSERADELMADFQNTWPASEVEA